MSDEQWAGSAQRVTGEVKSAVGNLAGDAKLKVEGGMDKVSGRVRQAVGDAAEGASELGRKARRVIDEDVAPAAAGAIDSAREYQQKATDAVAAGASDVAGWVRGNPLTAVGIAALASFVFGRMTAAPPPPPRYRSWF